MAISLLGVITSLEVGSSETSDVQECKSSCLSLIRSISYPFHINPVTDKWHNFFLFILCLSVHSLAQYFKTQMFMMFSSFQRHGAEQWAILFILSYALFIAIFADGSTWITCIDAQLTNIMCRSVLLCKNFSVALELRISCRKCRREQIYRTNHFNQAMIERTK